LPTSRRFDGDERTDEIWTSGRVHTMISQLPSTWPNVLPNALGIAIGTAGYPQRAPAVVVKSRRFLVPITYAWPRR
jgi:hypothetical protein